MSEPPPHARVAQQRVASTQFLRTPPHMASFLELVMQLFVIAITTGGFALVGWLPVMVIASSRDHQDSISPGSGIAVGSIVVPPRLLAFEAATAYGGFSFAILYFSFGFHFLLSVPAALYQAVCLYSYMQKWLNPASRSAPSASSKKDDNRGQVEL